MSIPTGVPLSEIPTLEPPPGVTPNFVNPHSLAPTLVAVNGVFIALMLVAVSIRIYSKGILLRSLGWDDYTCLLAAAGSTAHSGTLLSQTKFGYGTHLWDVPISLYLKMSLRALLADYITYQATTFLIKLSILLLYLRIFSISQRMRYLIWFGIGLQVAVYAPTIAIAIATDIVCPTDTPTTIGICDHEYQIEVFQGVFNLVTDFYVLVLPTRLVWNLQLSQRRKIGAIVLFGTGLLACTASLVRTVFLIDHVEPRDKLYQGAYISIFTAVELDTGIISGSLTVLPAFVEKSGIRHFNISTLTSLMKSRFSAKSNDSLDPSAKSSVRSKNPFQKIDMHLRDDRYIQLEAIKATSLDNQGQNACQDDVEGEHFDRDVFRTDDFDVAHLENGRRKDNAARLQQ